MTQPTKAMVELTVRVAAFGGRVAIHRVMADDVNVRVYDSVAGYYTLCHGLSKRSVARIIKKAAN